jgi:hypothetical protein
VGIGGFERRLEQAVEGTFARMFRSGVRPVELGRRLAREMDIARSVDVRGRVLVPNAFTVWLSAADHDQFAGIVITLESELAAAAREHARSEGYTFAGPVQVQVTTAEDVRQGSFRIEAHLVAGPGGVGAGTLVLSDGTRFVLDDQPVTIGRLTDCEVVLNDGRASRHHARIQPRGDEFMLVDLGSTNGTRVNGMQITEHVLGDGDVLVFGDTRIVFEAS